MLVLEGMVYLGGRLEDCSLGIEDGRIAVIKKSLRGDEHADYGGLLIIPGGIDIHVHFRDPGLTHKEDFLTGTTSAAMGGVTTVFDMPNTLPPTETLSAYETKVRNAGRKAFVDFGIYASLSKPREISRLAEARAPFKLYMAETTGGLAVPAEDVPKLLRDVPAEYAPVVVHAEDQAKFKQSKEKDLVQHNLARPVESESSCIEALSKMERRFHITHITSGEGLKSLAAGFTSDATPHHLLLDCESPLGQLGKVNPPLRDAAERAEVWKAFADGRIDMLASDHAPHTGDEKSVKFADAPSGMPGVETMMPLMLRRVKSGDLNLHRLVDALCVKPAGMMGLNKGSIEVGKDADLVVIDSRKPSKIKGKRLHSKCGWTAFEGFEAIFPAAVYLRGRLIVENGEVVEDALGGHVEFTVPAKTKEPARKPRLDAPLETKRPR